MIINFFPSKNVKSKFVSTEIVHNTSFKKAKKSHENFD